MKGWIASFILFILLIPTAFALTITPSKTTIEFVPNTTIIGSCSTITNPGCVCLTTHGETNVVFAGYGAMGFVINSSEFRFARTIKPYECYEYDITMPALAEKEGENLIRVTAIGDASSGGSVAVVLNVDQKLILVAEEKYAKPYVPPPLDIGKLLIYTSISLIFLLVILLIIKGRK